MKIYQYSRIYRDYKYVEIQSYAVISDILIIIIPFPLLWQTLNCKLRELLPNYEFGLGEMYYF